MHHRLHHYFGRHHGGRGFGHFGKGFMDGGDRGGRGFGMGRKLASVDLQLLILGLLEEKPRHGYEIIKALDERSKGFYVPSPGMVYPALTYLEEIGHATVETDGTRKLYQITDAGKKHLESNRSTFDALFTQFGRVGERMDRLRRAIHRDETGEEGGTEQEGRGSKELMRARHDLQPVVVEFPVRDRDQRLVLAAIMPVEQAMRHALGQA